MCCEPNMTGKLPEVVETSFEQYRLIIGNLRRKDGIATETPTSLTIHWFEPTEMELVAKVIYTRGEEPKYFKR